MRSGPRFFLMMSLHAKNHVTFIQRLSVQCLLLSVLATGDVGCPDKCVCKWKSGKETVECVDSGLTAIPPGIAPGTQVLDLNHNEIPIIKNGLFSNLGITNLQKIFCSHCNLVAVEERSFLHLTNLVELDLSENLLRKVPSRSLELTKALMRLSLSANPIKMIKAKAFEHLKFVTNLDLSHCSIETIEMNGFFGMESLLELRLESNHLSYLPGVNLFPRSVHLIEVSRPILPWLRAWKVQNGNGELVRALMDPLDPSGVQVFHHSLLLFFFSRANMKELFWPNA
eukprot:TCALIF_02236-PA protein Name:"Similar to Lrrtm3 Leucine-rich repeat transmembrane neuronal protein 3 (Mus musculus)" AED:0.31 eAED:0.32 QI:0/-1/0/1/-1/1/1/0/283